MMKSWPAAIVSVAFVFSCACSDTGSLPSRSRHEGGTSPEAGPADGGTCKRVALSGVPSDCEWEIPASSPGVELDPAMMNVELGLGTTITRLPYVPCAAACGSSNGWYVDDETAPTRIRFCPNICHSSTSMAAGGVPPDIVVVFGCPRLEADGGSSC